MDVRRLGQRKIARKEKIRNPFNILASRVALGVVVVAKLVSSLGTSREGAPVARAAHDSSGETGTGSSGEAGGSQGREVGRIWN